MCCWYQTLKRFEFHGSQDFRSSFLEKVRCEGKDTSKQMILDLIEILDWLRRCRTWMLYLNVLLSNSILFSTSAPFTGEQSYAFVLLNHSWEKYWVLDNKHGKNRKPFKENQLGRSGKGRNEKLIGPWGCDVQRLTRMKKLELVWIHGAEAGSSDCSSL